MKHLLLVAGLVLLLGGCGSEGVATNPVGEPLTAADYVAQGNLICGRLIEDLAAVEAQFSSELSTDEQRDLSVEAGSISQDALAELFALSPPASLSADRARLIEIWDEQQALFDNPADADDFFEQIEQLNDRFENQAERLWSECRN